MTAEQSIDLLKAIGGIISVVVWPALVLFIVVRYRRGLGHFFESLTDFTLKAGGVEASAKRRAEFAANLGAAIGNRDVASEDGALPPNPSDAVSVLEEAVPSRRALQRLEGAIILWVDDNPQNNSFERQALEALGIRFVVSKSTEEALGRIEQRDFDLIISDMGRPPDQRAGYTLLDELRKIGNLTPFVIYAGSDAPKHIAEAKRHGAIGSTNHPAELMRLVTETLVEAR